MYADCPFVVVVVAMVVCGLWNGRLVGEGGREGVTWC